MDIWQNLKQKNREFFMKRSLKILIVDDNESWMEALRTKLEDCGHIVYCANRQKIAKHHLDEGVDLALIDILLPCDPEGHGNKLIDWIRKEEKSCFIAAMSAIEENLEKIKDGMVDEKIEKPSSIDELVKIINGYDIDEYRNEKIYKSLILYSKRLDEIELKIGVVEEGVIYSAIEKEQTKHKQVCDEKFLTKSDHLKAIKGIGAILLTIIGGAIGWCMVTTDKMSMIYTKTEQNQVDIKKLQEIDDKMDVLITKIDNLRVAK
jgi:CheY-like chemotaxis protein